MTTAPRLPDGGRPAPRRRRRCSVVAIAAALLLGACSTDASDAARNIGAEGDSDPGNTDASDGGSSDRSATSDGSDAGNSDLSDNTDASDASDGGSSSDSSDRPGTGGDDRVGAGAAVFGWQATTTAKGFEPQPATFDNVTIEVDDVRQIGQSTDCIAIAVLADRKKLKTGDVVADEDSADLLRRGDAVHPIQLASLDIRTTKTEAEMAGRFDVMTDPGFVGCIRDHIVGSLLFQGLFLSGTTVTAIPGPPSSDSIGFTATATVASDDTGNLPFKATVTYVRRGRVLAALSVFDLGSGTGLIDSAADLDFALNLAS